MSDRPANQTDVLGWLEFACWTVLALAPFLRWVNGPAVSTDQLVVRTALVVLAAAGAAVLRITNWCRKRTRSRLSKGGAGADPPA